MEKVMSIKKMFQSAVVRAGNVLHNATSLGSDVISENIKKATKQVSETTNLTRNTLANAADSAAEALRKNKEGK
jgi:hypothetical protein